MSQKEYRFEPLEFSTQGETEMLENARKFYERMKSRRTVLHYSDQPVPREVIENAIRTAGTAPSGANMQPWHFVAVSDPAIKKEIRVAAEKEEKELYSHRASREWLEALAPLGTDEHKPFLETAPWLIAIFLKKFTIDAITASRKPQPCLVIIDGNIQDANMSKRFINVAQEHAPLEIELAFAKSRVKVTVVPVEVEEGEGGVREVISSPNSMPLTTVDNTRELLITDVPLQLFVPK